MPPVRICAGGDPSRRRRVVPTAISGSLSHDPGLTYDRDRGTVAVRVLSPDRALAEEARLIERLRPRDNLRGQPDDDLDEAVPF